MNFAAEVQTAAAAVPVSRNVLQTIAHELRQPLSAIESTAYYLGLVLPRGSDRARDHVARLRQLVEQSNWILSCGLQLTDETPLAPEQVDLEEFITEAIAATIVPSAPRPLLNLAGGLPPVELDPGRGRALLANVLMMFQQMSAGAHQIHVKTERDGEGVAMDLAVGVKGCSSEAGLVAGSTLCLGGVRRMVGAHGGTVTLAVDPQDGIRLRVVLPAH